VGSSGPLPRLFEQGLTTSTHQCWGLSSQAENPVSTIGRTAPSGSPRPRIDGKEGASAPWRFQWDDVGGQFADF
jgi:hypothetical protein